MKSAGRSAAADVSVLRAVEALKDGDPDKAVGEARKALRLHADHPDAQHVLADAHLSRDEFGDAVPLYRRVVGAKPSDVRARNSFGVALLRSGDRAGALEQFEAIQRIDPANEAAKRNVRILRRELGVE